MFMRSIAHLPCLKPHQVGLVVSLSAPHADSAVRLSERLGSMWICLCRHALKRSTGINCKSRVLYPGLGFLSSVTWPSMLEKHSNGLII